MSSRDTSGSGQVWIWTAHSRSANTDNASANPSHTRAWRVMIHLPSPFPTTSRNPNCLQNPRPQTGFETFDRGRFSHPFREGICADPADDEPPDDQVVVVLTLDSTELSFPLSFTSPACVVEVAGLAAAGRHAVSIPKSVDHLQQVRRETLTN